ncbi:MAG: hypothetical protein P4L67_00325 [Candidatus Pacebacteria bacterium]|nr:hypothetical protein [Candidatus Paceibacterota bacterium]
MEAPHAGSSLKDLNEKLKYHFQLKYRDSNGGQLCKECGKKILFVTCHVSIHETPPGGACEGFGTVRQFPLPYCPHCEGVPKSTSTCVHVGTGSVGNILGEIPKDVGQLEHI